MNYFGRCAIFLAPTTSPNAAMPPPMGNVKIVSHGNVPHVLVPSLNASSTKNEATNVINMGARAKRIPPSTNVDPRRGVREELGVRSCDWEGASLRRRAMTNAPTRPNKMANGDCNQRNNTTKAAPKMTQVLELCRAGVGGGGGKPNWSSCSDIKSP